MYGLAMEIKRDRGLDIDGAELRRRRKLQGQERADLATRVGVTPGYISHLENGHRKPSPTVFRHLCEALGMPEREWSALLLEEKAA